MATVNVSKPQIKINDKFEVIVKVHHLFGLMYYRYRDGKYKFRHFVISIMYQFFIFALIINFCTPCLLHQFDCHFKRTFLDNGYALWYWQGFCFCIIKNVVAIVSCLAFSFKGTKIRRLIEELRKFIHQIASGDQSLDASNVCKKLNVYMLVLHISIFGNFLAFELFHIITNQISGTVLIYVSISEFYSEALNFSADFFLIYFVTYLSIVYNLFICHLRCCAQYCLTYDDIKALKANLTTFGELVNKINELLCPSLLLIVAQITYETITCLYLIVRSFQVANVLATVYVPTVTGIVVCYLRLILLCYSGEHVTNQVNVILLLVSFYICFHN